MNVSDPFSSASIEKWKYLWIEENAKESIHSWCKFIQVYFHFVKYTETGSGTWQLHHLRLNQMLRQCVLELQTHRNTRSHISGSGDAEACPVHARGLIAGLRGQRVTNCATHGGQHWCGLLPKHWNTTWRSVKKDKWTPTPTVMTSTPASERTPHLNLGLGDRGRRLPLIQMWSDKGATDVLCVFFSIRKHS